MFVRSILTGCAGVFAMSLGPAIAQSLTGNVGSAGVTDGEQGIELRYGMDNDNNAGARVHYDYAFTDWYQLRVIASLSKSDGGDWDPSALTLENWFQWREEQGDQSSFNGGFRIAYAIPEGGGPGEAEARLTVTDKFASAWEWRANLIAEIETGQGSEGGASLEARGQLTRALPLNALGSDSWRFGGEVFSELGNTRNIPGFDDQAHQVGPVVKIDWPGGIYLQSALRVGITDGADDGMFKLFIGREF
ncbi:MAG: hypothetical protein AAGF20_13085 [Pseudomonadota bacterium]